VVFDGTSQPLDLGRERRCVSLAQRKAVAARDRGCAHPGCHRTPAWCQVHHIHITSANGSTAAKTNIEDLLMLCRSHHRMIHQSGWEVRMHLGRPEFIPPRWVDPNQAPRRQPMLV
jgi:5-methylcytosine-specific restriction protein A